VLLALRCSRRETDCREIGQRLSIFLANFRKKLKNLTPNLPNGQFSQFAFDCKQILCKVHLCVRGAIYLRRAVFGGEPVLWVRR
jgi:hypothetical protein